MKFLPAAEFEKRQKSLNQNQLPAIMSSTSMINKIGFLVDFSSPPSSYLSSTDCCGCRIESEENHRKTSDVIENKKKANELKEKGNHAFKKKKYEEAENFYSEALQLNPDSRPLWTNRAACRNTMKKHDDALTDCLSALSIDPKNTKKGIQTVF